MNSSKSTPQSSKHPLIKKNYMQKCLNLLFRPNGDVEGDIACVSILQSSQWATRQFFSQTYQRLVIEVLIVFSSLTNLINMMIPQIPKKRGQ
jgi:hypothetical protein